MNLSEVYSIVAKNLRISFNGVPADLDPNDRFRLFEAAARYVVSNPTLFSPAQVEAARKYLAGFGGYQETGYGIGEKIGDFFTEAGAQGQKIIGQTGVSLRNALYIFAAVLAAVLVFRFTGKKK